MSTKQVREDSRKTCLEKKECDNGRWLSRNFLGEIERPQERRSVHERWEQGQDGEDVELRDQEEFRRVHIIPMSELMRCTSD